MNILHLLIPLYLVFTGCNLFNTGNDQEKFEPTFRADINGEIFDITQVKVPLGRYNAVLSTQGAYSYLAVFASIFDIDFYPYKETISVSIFWIEEETVYSTKIDSMLIGDFYLRTGAKYFEADGDAIISTYISSYTDTGFISVEFEKLSEERDVVFGNFEFTVIVDSRTDQFSQRVGQDTLHITNGEYRLLLDDRRED